MIVSFKETAYFDYIFQCLLDFSKFDKKLLYMSIFFKKVLCHNLLPFSLSHDHLVTSTKSLSISNIRMGNLESVMKAPGSVDSVIGTTEKDLVLKSSGVLKEGGILT